MQVYELSVQGECGACVNRVEGNPSRREGVETLPYKIYYKEEAAEEKCKCIECYDEDSGKYKYWVGAPELVKYFEGVQG